MEAVAWQPRDEENTRMVDGLPIHVIAALDRVTPTERDGVLTAISDFSRHAQEGIAIPDTESLYLLWAAPELRVIVRRTDPNGAVEVEDVVQPATLRAFAAADVS